MTRVLVVEDNADLAFAVTTALQSEGYDVAIAFTGPEGVARARAGDADLIILDLMPGLRRIPRHSGAARRRPSDPDPRAHRTR